MRDCYSVEASKELDAQIAIARGLVWDDAYCPVCGWVLATTPSAGCVPGNCSRRPKPRRRADAPLPYSTDLAAAWTLVEWLRMVHDLLLEVRPYSLETGGGYRVAVKWTYQEIDYATAETAPLAICRAFLSALNRVPKEQHIPVILGLCSRCNQPLDNVAPGFSIVSGGALVCANCLRPGEELLRARGI